MANIIGISDNMIILAMIVGGLLLVAVALLIVLLVICLRRQAAAKVHLGARYKVRRSDVSNVNYINEQTVFLNGDNPKGDSLSKNASRSNYTSSNSKISTSFYPFSSFSSGNRQDSILSRLSCTTLKNKPKKWELRHKNFCQNSRNSSKIRPISITFYNNADEVIDARKMAPRVARVSDVSGVNIPPIVRREVVTSMVTNGQNKIQRNSVESSRDSYFSLYNSENSTAV